MVEKQYSETTALFITPSCCDWALIFPNKK